MQLVGNNGSETTISFSFPDAEYHNVYQPVFVKVDADGNISSAVRATVDWNPVDNPASSYTWGISDGFSLYGAAQDAISTWDGDDYNSTGGIVKCTNSTFLNNRRCAEFMAYTNHDASNQECSNVSYFTLCNFIVNDNNMFEANNATFGSFITMWGVNGIKLKGCTFDDQCTTPHTTCHAIGTADAGYSLTEYCSNFNPRLSCNCLATPVRSSVKNVAMGVEASNSGTNYAPNINRTDFH